MKTKKLVAGLAVAGALAAAIPAVAATHPGPQGRASSAAVKDSAARHRRHPRVAKREASSAAITSAPFTAESLSAAARAELARSGSTVLPISFSGPGTVLASGEAAVGTATETAIGTTPDGRAEPIQVPSEYTPAIRPASVTATAAGTADLTISLTPWAKSRLATGHDVDVFLSLEPAQGASESIPGLAMFVELPGS
ncbi:MAG TPA: hypothetical protein VJL81_12815 [Solirubrobacterales bacterium]|nr:hypothetical protein [Solirubrobacterales bacterium]